MSVGTFRNLMVEFNIWYNPAMLEQTLWLARLENRGQVTVSNPLLLMNAIINRSMQSESEISNGARKVLLTSSIGLQLCHKANKSCQK